MNASAIDFGFATIRLLTGPNPDSAEPVGVVAWDRSRRWFDVRLLATDEVRRGISSSRLALARVAERDLRNWASDQRVPYAPSSAEPWTGEFWHAVHRFFSSGVRMDAPSAMQRMETPEEEFPLLFDAIARPRTSASRRKVSGYINEALGHRLRRHFLARPTLGAFGGRDEVVTKAAVGVRSAVVVEGVNLAHHTGRRDADALVSRLERVIEGQLDQRRLHIVVGYLASPGGLNGEADMKAWIEERVATDGVYNLLSEERRFREATKLALDNAGIGGSGSLFGRDEAGT